LAVAIATAGCTDEIPPLGEALLVVDTDLPVPRLAARLRLDVYSSDGTQWQLSRDVALPDPGAWPASFSLYNPEEGASRSALVRLRVYPQGKVRDYRGERFAPKPDGSDPAARWVPGDPSPNEGPRLIIDGVDLTPPTEPLPLVAVDRLLSLQLKPGERGRLRVTLRGACSGTQADLAGQSTCVEFEGQRIAVPAAALESDMSLPTQSAEGSFGGEIACTAEPRPASTLGDGTPLFDEEACIPGGGFVFGNADVLRDDAVRATPERLAVLPPFRLDRYEVTVGRWRQAIANGFSSLDNSPLPNEAVLAAEAAIDDEGLCTWSQAPLGRENMPLNCVSWQTARAFCQFLGGDLPTEAQWEYAAQVSGRPHETRYPWGDGQPRCDLAIYGRLATGPQVQQFHAGQCIEQGWPAGPQAVDAAAGFGADRTPVHGLTHLAGGLGELVLDSSFRFDEACVVSAPLLAPACLATTTTQRVARGGFWSASGEHVFVGVRQGSFATDTLRAEIGFRCARGGGP